MADIVYGILCALHLFFAVKYWQRARSNPWEKDHCYMCFGYCALMTLVMAYKLILD